jgi:hypothetical protein
MPGAPGGRGGQNTGVTVGGKPYRVAIESTSRRSFATAVDWPGWSRAGRTEEAALENLGTYRARYAAVARHADLELSGSAALEVTERLPGGGHTDFGVPGAALESDLDPLRPAEVKRQLALLEAAWKVYDDAAAGTGELRKGPRGGGRDRARVWTHLLEAECAYAGLLGLKLRPPPGHEAAALRRHRRTILDRLREVAEQPPPEPQASPRRWTFRYAVRRTAWHALDHAWEIEDRAEPA